MTLNVRFFASLREQLGCEHIAIDSAKAQSLEELMQRLHELLPAANYQALCGPHIRVAVNQEFICGNPTLRAGDEVAFLPPVTGG